MRHGRDRCDDRIRRRSPCQKAVSPPCRGPASLTSRQLVTPRSEPAQRGYEGTRPGPRCDWWARRIPLSTEVTFGAVKATRHMREPIGLDSADAPWRSPGIFGRPSACRSRRSPIVPASRRRPSRRTSTTRLMLTKDLRTARRRDGSGRSWSWTDVDLQGDSSALAATARGRAFSLPDLSGCGSLERRRSGPRCCP